jgi:UDPglucose 6-dehydrogenase
MKIAVVGLGYVGLANAAMLARDHEVVGLDRDPSRVHIVNMAHSPFEDAMLSTWLKEAPLHLLATCEPHRAYLGASYVIIAVPTNYDESTGCFDTSIVEQVVDDANRLSPSDAILVIRSTVPVGFTAEIQSRYTERTILFVPEFLREGRAFLDTLQPTRVIIGGMPDERLGRMLTRESPHGWLSMNTTEAEAVKLFSNTYLAMRVAYFNELDTFASEHGLDTAAIINGVSKDPRIGPGYNNPSFGYGGYCLPKDTKQLRANYAQIPETLISAIVESNQTRKDFIVSDILRYRPKTVGIYRLVMKTGSNNFRESAVLDIAQSLSDAGIQVIAYEPELVEDTLGTIKVVGNLHEFTVRSDLIVANRLDDQITRVREKVYTRDIFNRD